MVVKIFAHLLITSKPLFQNIFPNNILKASLQRELTKYLSASSDTKNIFINIEKVYAHPPDKHQCSQDSISRIKILISNP